MKIILLLCLLTAGGCSSHRVKCDGSLTPINAPAALPAEDVRSPSASKP